MSRMDRLGLPQTENGAALIDYWMHQRSGNGLPARHDIDPAEIPGLLPHLALVDVVHRGSRFRVRLAGDAPHNLLGGGVAGGFVDELAGGGELMTLVSLMGQAVSTARPGYGLAESHGHGHGHGEDGVLVEGVVLPLSTDGRTIDCLLTGCFPLRPEV